MTYEQDLDRHQESLETENDMRDAGIESIKRDMLGDEEILKVFVGEVMDDIDSDIINVFTNPLYFHALLEEKLTDEATSLYDHRWSWK